MQQGIEGKCRSLREIKAVRRPGYLYSAIKYRLRRLRDFCRVEPHGCYLVPAFMHTDKRFTVEALHALEGIQ